MMPVSFATLNQDIDLWLSQNEFGKIDRSLKNIDSNNPKYISILRKKPIIDERKNAFIKSTLSKANKFKNSQQWAKALKTYNKALLKTGNNPKLLKGKAVLLKKRDEKIIALQKILLMKRATALISYKKVYGKLNKLSPLNKSAQTDIHNYNRERLSVAKQLEACGNQANREKQFTQAKDCYYLSNTLEPSKQKQLWVKLLSKRLKNKYAQKRHDELLTAYKRAYGSQKYSKAQLHLQTLLAIDPSHKHAKRLLLTLNKEINTQALNKIEAGKEFYSQKKIDDALKVWLQALRLDPDNKELAQLISRAEKVRKKIQSLQKSQ